MPLLNDLPILRALLAHDPPWAVYAICDLMPGIFEDCSWHVPAGGGAALALLQRSFQTPILWAQGDARELETILDEITSDPALFLQVRPEMIPLLETRCEVTHRKLMLRMALDPVRFAPCAADGVARLIAADREAVGRLYDAGDGPDFYFPSMLDQGVFFGAWERGELVAVAGTHIVAPSEGAAAIGNVYTRRDARGRGLATALTSAVVQELLRIGVRIIALGVRENNAPAIAAYRRLGFSVHCEYYEARASRRG